MNGMSPVGSFRFSRQSPARYSRRRSKEPFSSIPKFNGPVDTLCKVLERRACLAKRTSGRTGGWLFSIFTYVCVLDVQSRQRTGPSPVPAVRSADLKSAWEFQNKILAAYAGQQMIIDIRGVCSPGADVAAVGFRVSMLWMLKKIQEFPGNPPDVLFDALAIVPMIGMAPGVPQQGLPFDLDELLKLVQK